MQVHSQTLIGKRNIATYDQLKKSVRCHLLRLRTSTADS